MGQVPERAIEQPCAGKPHSQKHTYDERVSKKHASQKHSPQEHSSKKLAPPKHSPEQHHNILLIGGGRLATHLHHFFQLKQISHRCWSRRHGAVSPHGASDLDGDTPSDLRDLITWADRVLLAIRDDALQGFVERNQIQERTAGQDQLWVHFSGSTVVQGAWTAHPLCTFAHGLYEPEVYASIPFVIEREGPPFAQLLPGLDNPSAEIPRSSKALYHALCVTAGNFTQLLWQQLFSAFESQLGLPASLAVPYLRQTCRNLEQNAGQDVLTGPLARRDHQTIETNLASLHDADLASLANVYEAFLQLADINTLEIA